MPGFIKWGLGFIAVGALTIFLAAMKPADPGSAAYGPLGYVFILIGAVFLTRPIWRRFVAERSARR